MMSMVNAALAVSMLLTVALGVEDKELYGARMNIVKVWRGDQAPPLEGAPNPGNWSQSVWEQNFQTDTGIVNGDNSNRREFPYMVSYMEYFPAENFWYHICGGSLIAPNKVLTAAHCLGSTGRLRAVSMGFVDFNNPGSSLQFINVRNFVSHPGNSNADFLLNDVAVLTLSASASINSYVSTIPLAAFSEPWPGKKCTLTGWGQLSGSGGSPSILQKAEVRVLFRPVCDFIWKFITRRSPAVQVYNVCTLDFVQSPCFGDSGGPLVCDGRVAGIVSWGYRDCSTFIPSVYTQVSYFKLWILSQL